MALTYRNHARLIPVMRPTVINTNKADMKLSPQVVEAGKVLPSHSHAHDLPEGSPMQVTGERLANRDIPARSQYAGPAKTSASIAAAVSARGLVNTRM